MSQDDQLPEMFDVASQADYLNEVDLSFWEQDLAEYERRVWETEVEGMTDMSFLDRLQSGLVRYDW